MSRRAPKRKLALSIARQQCLESHAPPPTSTLLPTPALSSPEKAGKMPEYASTDPTLLREPLRLLTQLFHNYVNIIG